MTRQIRVSCSRAIFANGAIGMCLAEVNIATSNNNVKPLPGRAHGTFTRCTPWSAHRTRGTRAARYPWCSKKSRCRQVLSTVSCTAQLVWAQPCSGHPNREPRGKSSPRSSRPASGSNSPETTCHGTARPNAAPNISFKSNPSSRPTDPITARRHHRNQSQNGRRSTRPPTRNSEEPLFVWALRRRLARAGVVVPFEEHALPNGPVTPDPCSVGASIRDRRMYVIGYQTEQNSPFRPGGTLQHLKPKGSPVQSLKHHQPEAVPDPRTAGQG